MHDLINSRIFQLAAVFGLVGCSLVLMMQLNAKPLARELADPVAAEVPPALVPVAPLVPAGPLAPAELVTSIANYDSQQTKGSFRVSLLGFTQGVSFLDSQEPAIDGGRGYGNNAVSWVRAAVLVESLGDDPPAFGPVAVEFQTPDGSELVEQIKYEIVVNGETRVIDGHGSGVAFFDIDGDFSERALFPVTSPEVESPGHSMVLLATESGHIDTTPGATILLRFGEGDSRQEFLFENVPIP